MTVDYATADGTATAPADYTAASGTLTFAAGQTDADGHRARQRRRRSTRTTRPSSSTSPNAGERDDRRRHRASARSPTTTAPRSAINDVTVTEGNAGTVNATFTVTLSRAQRPDRHGRLRHGRRHGDRARPTTRPTSGTLTFAAGQTTADDHRPGQRRHCSTSSTRPSSSTSSNAVNATIADAGHRHDHRRRRRCRALDQRRDGDRGRRGHVDATFTVTPRRASGQPVTVDYATANGTATAPRTTRAASGTLTFAPGADAQTVTVPVNGDLLDEIDETFIVDLVERRQRDDRRRPGLGTITDDDAAAGARDRRRRRVTEGDAGTVDADLHRHALEPGQRADGDGRLRDRDGTRDARRPTTPPRAARSPSPPGGDADGHGAGHTATRSTRTTRRFTSTSSAAAQRHARRRQGDRHDHRRRPAAHASPINDATRHRGRRRHGRRDLHGHALERRAAGTVTVDYATANGTATAPGRLHRRRAAR